MILLLAVLPLPVLAADLSVKGSVAKPLSLSLAALRWHGYRSEHRYTVFQSLTHTLKLPAEQWRVLDQAHRKRNLAEYEGDLDVDAALLAALIRVALEVAARAEALGAVKR